MATATRQLHVLIREQRRETMRFGSRTERALDVALSLGRPRQTHLRRHFRRLERDPEYREAIHRGARLVEAMVRARGFSNAKNTGTKGPWNSATGSADAHVQPDHKRLTEHARELVRDDPLAAGLLKNMRTNVVGTGIKPQARVMRTGTDGTEVADDDTNRLLEEAFRERQDDLDAAHGCSWHEITGLIFDAAQRDGDVWVRPAVYGVGAPMQMEIVEKDRVATPLGAKPLVEGGRIVDGIEKDQFGRINAYWIRKTHPGEPAQIGQKSPDKGLQVSNFERVDARDVFRLYAPQRPGQSNGVTCLHAVIQDLRDLDLLTVASMKRVQIAADLAIFFQTPEGPDEFTKGLLGDTDVSSMPTASGRLEATIEPGMMWKLDPGEEVSTLVPNFPTPELFPFVKMICMRIAAALGITWEEVLRNWSEDNYSSARSGLIESRATYRVLQTWFARRILTPMWRVVLTDAVIRNPGKFDGLPAGAIDQVRWVFPGWQWVDPQKEVKAAVLALEAGIATFQDILAQRGIDWEDHFHQLARERAMLEELGLEDLVAKMFGGQQHAPDEAEELDEEDSPARRTARRAA
jgi:lambda family phage portal protein